MFNTRAAGTTEFKEGDNVVLAEGTYQGTVGVFSRLREDVNWAEIIEPSGAMRCHPVVWLQHVLTCEPEPRVEHRNWVSSEERSGAEARAALSDEESEPMEVVV